MAKNTIPDFDTTAGNNLDVASISVAEGWLPSTVNNFERAWMAIAKKDYLDKGGQVTVGGTANAITVTSASPASYQSLISGLRLRFAAGSSNSGATTLNLDSLGAKAVRKIVGGTDVALVTGDILAGKHYDIVYSTAANGAAGGWIIEPSNLSGFGGQLAFPATQNASSDANTLDDYEEGLIVPTIEGLTAAGVGTYTVQGGSYTKIGNMVFFTISLSWSAHTGTGNMQIAGLPFTSASGTADFRYVLSFYEDSLTITGRLAGFVNNSATTIVLNAINNGTAAALAMDTAATIRVSGAYRAAA